MSELAGSQHALVTWTQALDVGFSSQAVRRRVETGRWVRVHDGVYRIAGARITNAQSVLAACMGIGPEAAASHRAAAVLHGLLTYRDPVVEVSTTRIRSPELPGVVVHRLADLAPRWVSVVDAVPCTTVARTLVDLGAVCHPRTVEAALDKAVGRRLTTLREIRHAMLAVARQGRRGVGTIRQLLAARSDADRPSSVLEARMVSLLVTSEVLPRPTAEHVVRDEHGGFIAIVDFAYPECRLAIEVDGYEPHMGLAAFKHDRARDRLLAGIAWLALHYTWGEIDSQAPHVLAEISSEYRRRLNSRNLGTLMHK